jgi:hypothetical protein
LETSLPLLVVPGRPKGRRRSFLTLVASTLSTLKGGLAITKSQLPHRAPSAGGARRRKRIGLLDIAFEAMHREVHLGEADRGGGFLWP